MGYCMLCMYENFGGGRMKRLEVLVIIHGEEVERNSPKQLLDLIEMRLDATRQRIVNLLIEHKCLTVEDYLTGGECGKN